jgi:hypothetical protein
MKMVAFLASAFLMNFAQGPSPPRNTPPAVERLCGKLMHVQHVPDKVTQNAFEDKTKNLPHVSVQLYRDDGNRKCCDGLPLVAEGTTGRWGSFQLKEKGLTEGLYWVVARYNLRTYQLLLRFEPKKNSTELCSDVSFQLDDAGNFWEAVKIVVE